MRVEFAQGTCIFSRRRRGGSSCRRRPSGSAPWRRASGRTESRGATGGAGNAPKHLIASTLSRKGMVWREFLAATRRERNGGRRLLDSTAEASLSLSRSGGAGTREGHRCRRRDEPCVAVCVSGSAAVATARYFAVSVHFIFPPHAQHGKCSIVAC